jgi:hypothetical protein
VELDSDLIADQVCLQRVSAMQRQPIERSLTRNNHMLYSISLANLVTIALATCVQE